jgi:hypothetical protein
MLKVGVLTSGEGAVALSRRCSTHSLLLLDERRLSRPARARHPRALDQYQYDVRFPTATINRIATSVCEVKGAGSSGPYDDYMDRQREEREARRAPAKGRDPPGRRCRLPRSKLEWTIRRKGSRGADPVIPGPSRERAPREQRTAPGLRVPRAEAARGLGAGAPPQRDGVQGALGGGRGREIALEVAEGRRIGALDRTLPTGKARDVGQGTRKSGRTPGSRQWAHLEALSLLLSPPRRFGFMAWQRLAVGLLESCQKPGLPYHRAFPACLRDLAHSPLISGPG